jgi:hypothetical protein
MNCGLRRTIVVSADALTDQVGGGATEHALQLPSQTGVDQVLPRLDGLLKTLCSIAEILEFEDPQRFRLR